MSDLYDVIAINIKTKAVRVLARAKSLTNAERVAFMATKRHGVTEELYTEAPAGMYADGDAWKGVEE